MSLEFQIKPYDQLSVPELYQILRLRSEIFVVEQDCVYQDIDNKDQKALHVLGTFNTEIVVYARIFKGGDYFENSSIGRVVIAKDFRDRKWGHQLMREAIAGINNQFGESQITISAQLYLKQFYESHGFVQTGDRYLEDGIPHIEMKRS